ncbi:major facilitator superfamily [Holotrichia oblita]|uniref:Major facilitator superfamily n=2 Tax=Holotrichia oblita TaxID=644536 RepID=A0ACB9TCL5_HOLOL|nr:major facilitator superfamily [Holotrichia oblita]KAI4464410.1 major facilitator superfamily [Holotrichia oblita]
MEMIENNKSQKYYSGHFTSYSASLSSEIKYDIRKRYRSKSLSTLEPQTFCQSDIRRIRERLLRTNSHIQPSAIKSFSKSQKMTLVSLAIVDFLSFCSMSIMAPFFPKEASEKGLSDVLSGFVFSFYALVMFLTSPIFGKILPKVGAKFLFISGVLIAGICNLLFGMLEFVHNYTLFTCYCFLIRGLEALGASAFSTASYVFVVNSFPNHIGSVLGILETFVGFGMSTGPALGGILYSVYCNFSGKTNSMWELIKVPAVVMTGFVVIVVSSTWSFLDPTLEPHLRQFNLTPEKVGLIFLLFSALYGVSSPIWGWLADKCVNHWLMMVWGLVQCTLGLLLLGPCPYIPFIYTSVWLNLVALSILGVSVALALLPTFQGVLKSAIEYGWSDSLATYSMVAGIWSCMYSLGEVIGPALGGVLLQYYGFPISASIMAAMTFILAVVTCIYFCIKTYCYSSYTDSNDNGETTNGSSNSYTSSESTPLLMSLEENSNTYKLYTKEKVQYLEKSRKTESFDDEFDANELRDIRRTVAITPKGACEV